MLMSYSVMVSVGNHCQYLDISTSVVCLL